MCTYPSPIFTFFANKKPKAFFAAMLNELFSLQPCSFKTIERWMFWFGKVLFFVRHCQLCVCVCQTLPSRPFYTPCFHDYNHNHNTLPLYLNAHCSGVKFKAAYLSRLPSSEEKNSESKVFLFNLFCHHRVL